MADPPSLIVSYLKLPPDEQLFFKLRDIFQTILEKLNHLALVLAAAQDPQPLPKVKKAVRELQENAGRHCRKGVDVALSCKSYAESMVELAGSLPEATKDNGFLLKIGVISRECQAIVEECDTAIEGMEQLRQEVPPTVDRITVALNDGDDTRADLVMTSENSQAVNDLIQAAGDCSPVFRLVKEHFQEAKQHFENKEYFRTNSPSEEEIKMMRERWNIFASSIEEISTTIAHLRGKISMGPRIFKAPTLAQDVRDQEASAAKSSSTSKPAARNAITNGSASEADLPGGAESSNLQTSPWWRSWWRRFISCLTFKHFH